MINILVAHHAEAKPFLGHYGLTETRQGGLDLYCNGSVRLLVTGQGPARTGRSLSALWRAIPRAMQDYWLNFGVAGAAMMAPGTLVVVNTVYPGAVAVDHCQTQLSGCQPGFDLTVSRCLSVDQPTSDYPDEGVVDMEAATIGSVLARYGVADRLTILKLVSDGPDAPPGGGVAMAALIAGAAAAACAVSDMILCHLPNHP